GLAAFILSAVFSGSRFIKPRDKSQAVVYPVNLNSYSIESRADQLLQLLESNSIRDSVIHRFDLLAHYNMDTTGTSGRAALYNLYKERVTIEKTRYESVEIHVEDENPVMTRDMVASILDQTDLLARRLQRKNSGELLTIVQSGLTATRLRMDSVESRLNALRANSGLLDYDAQAKELTKGYMKVISGHGSAAQKEEIGGMLKSLETNGGEFYRLTELNDQLIVEYGKKQEEERVVQMDLSKVLTYTNVVVYPEVSDKKVYPIRWLIVLVATAMAMLLCYILVFLRDRASEDPIPAERG
ncbi:MAG: hypothetical protein ABIQ75_07725, partial [Flavobacteriales bacterium]